MPRKLFTYDPNDPKHDEEIIEVIRSIVRIVNKASPQVKLRITQSARQANKKYAWKYENKHAPRLRLEDAKQIDVYLDVRQTAKGRTNRKKARRRAS